MSIRLLGYGNAKTVKGESLGYLTAILHLAPSRLSGFNVCPMASAGCIAGCLNTAGRGIYDRTQQARIRKTRQFFQDRELFMAMLVLDIRAVVRRAARLGMLPAIRLNGTSDIRWENIPVFVDGRKYRNIMAVFPDVAFYDYTKIANRRNLPKNYTLTFSRSESNDAQVAEAMRNGMNVAVVFHKVLPARWNRRRVIDGTETDLRFRDPKKVIVGLIAKGKARRDTSGFVIR